jgi:hypothetical protein
MWWYLGISVVVSICFYIWCINSHEGYQDESGFHYGKDPRNGPVDPNRE